MYCNNCSSAILTAQSIALNSNPYQSYRASPAMCNQRLSTSYCGLH